jgi:amino acid transporter
MKKFSFLSSVFLLIVVVVFLFVGCQKETATTEETNNVISTESPVVKGISGNSTLAGSISTAYAAALQANFKDKYGDNTYQIAFSAKDLSTFISKLQGKYKSDVIYVNFGLYGQGAPAVNWKDNGRLTVFFTGNNIKSNISGSVKTDGISSSDRDEDAYLNHGQMYP